MDIAVYHGVFVSHPKADKIFVVKGQPFLDEGEANNYARNLDDKTVTLVKRDECVAAQKAGTKKADAGKADAGKADAGKADAAEAK